MRRDDAQAEQTLVGLLRRQKAWAIQQGHDTDGRGYVTSLDANLWRPLSATSRAAFEKGSGSELKGKMHALHSSSALAVNFFDYWTSADPTVLRDVLELPATPMSIEFEAQFPTGLRGTPPNIDVAIILDSGHTVAIESKFTEWLTRKPVRKPAFKPKYFPVGEELWESKGLRACQSLAVDIQGGRQRFLHFDAPQMLKHALGLATQVRESFNLWYFYFECCGRESAVHNAEIRIFADRVGAEIGLKSLSYQQLFSRLEMIPTSINPDYVEYLRRRYISPAAGFR